MGRGQGRADGGVARLAVPAALAYSSVFALVQLGLVVTYPGRGPHMWWAVPATAAYLTAAERLHAELPSCRTLILTGLSQPGNLLRALKAHARGFVRKDAPAASLAEGIRRVAAGRRYIDADLVAEALETGASPLTPRETDVLRAAEGGMSTGDIAALLSLSPATVRNYLSNAITKTNARNRIDALRIARDAGWI